MVQGQVAQVGVGQGSGAQRASKRGEAHELRLAELVLLGPREVTPSTCQSWGAIPVTQAPTLR